MRINLTTSKQNSFSGKISQFFKNEVAKLKLAKEVKKELLESTDDERLQCNIAYSDPYHILRIKELCDLGVDLYGACTYSYNDGKFYRYIRELAQNGKYDRYALLVKLNVPGFYIDKYIELGDKEFTDSVALLESGINSAIALDLARKYKNNLSSICEYSKTGKISTNAFSYFLEKEKKDSRFSNKNIVEIASKGVFSERMISDILSFDKKDSVLNSETLNDSFEALDKLNKKKSSFFSSLDFNRSYLDLDTPYNGYDFVVNNLLKITEVDLEKYPFDKKTKIYFEIQSIINSGAFSYEEINQLKLVDALALLHNAIANPITLADVSSQDTKVFFRNFIANNNPELKRTLENFDFSKYEKTGLPLKYSRESYIKDLRIVLKDCNAQKRKEIFKKLEITSVSYKNSFGYDGVITLKNLDLTDSIEKKVAEISNKFIYENEIITDDESFNKIANSIIKGMPEFINIIGKKQHRNQALDVHSLLVLQNIIKHPDYNNLSNKNKTILKFVALLHDIAKLEAVLDSTHPVRSSMYAKTILKRYKQHPDLQKNISDIILNHHWLENYSKRKISAERVAFNFREDENFKIAKILTEADLKGVNDSFYQMHKKQLSSSNLAPITQKIEDINSHGQLIFSSKIIRPDLVPKVNYKDREYRVINFSDYRSNHDLSTIGFEPGTNIDNLRLIAHMVKNPINLEAALSLSELNIDSLLCASFISLKKKATYYDLNFGLSLDSSFNRIANADKENQSSGRKKGDAQFDYIITSNSYRNFIPTEFTKLTGITSQEYGEIYKQISRNRYLSQISSKSNYGTLFSRYNGEELKDAIRKTDDKLLHRNHNELNVYKPIINAFIAKVDYLHEIPEVYLDFVYKHNLPIFILGK